MTGPVLVEATAPELTELGVLGVAIVELTIV
jgi:hypothetical protein